MKKYQSPYVRPTEWTRENGVPVNMYGYTAVYGAPPELTDEHIIQKNNTNEIKKIHLKRSDEIKSNYIGVCTTRMPRVPEEDYNPVQAVNLIDGNDETCWSSHLHIRKDEYPVWIRIDLAKETKLKTVVIKKRPVTFERAKYRGSFLPDPGAEEIGRAMVKKVKIQTSVDAYEWKINFDGEVDRDKLETFEFDMGMSPCKQLLIIGDDMAACENWGYSFSIASIEAIDENGNNVALHSKGACVTVSSTHHLSMNERGAAMYNWQLHMDLGVKWSRIGYHDDPINWHWVEREKGVLKMDPMAEDAIDMLCENGVNIVYCLNFGNRLYEGYAERRFPQLKEWYYETPYPPRSEEALKAWDEFVRFSVNYFKDRIKYFEIWNEWNGEPYWGDIPDAEHYISIVKRTIPIIRECAPDAKVMLGSFAGFVHDQTPDNCDKNVEMFYRAIDELAPLVDVIGYHPFYQPAVDGDGYVYYTDNVNRFKKYCEEKGFKGNEYMASELSVGAMYPPTLEGTPGCWFGENGKVNFSEIEKAKIFTQFHVKHTALGVHSLVCELSNHDYPLELSLLRKGFDTFPIQATNPNMAYYATRNACTILDGYKPAGFDFECSDTDRIDIYAMENDKHKAVAVWTTHETGDYCEGRSVDIAIKTDAEHARAYNIINGEVTELNTLHDGEMLVIRDVIVRDAPILIETDKVVL